METKVCRKCATERPRTEFGFANKAKGWLRYQCKSCDKIAMRALYATNEKVRTKAKARSSIRAKTHPRSTEQQRVYQMRYSYGLTEADYEAMLAAQHGKCVVCLTTDPGRQKGKWATGRWTIDHCHDTGRVRGLVCHICNLRLGGYERLLKDRDRQWLETYLKK